MESELPDDIRQITRFNGSDNYIYRIINFPFKCPVGARLPGGPFPKIELKYLLSVQACIDKVERFIKGELNRVPSLGANSVSSNFK